MPIGDNITINGVEVFVEGITIDYPTDDFAKVTLTCRGAAEDIYQLLEGRNALPETSKEQSPPLEEQTSVAASQTPKRKNCCHEH